MAFVSRSERKIIIATSDKEIPGPGQYIRMPIMNMTTTQSKAPFNSSFMKEKYIKEPSPGPGSYNIQLQQSKSTQDISKAINTNTNASSVDLNSTNQILVKNTNEKLGFWTKVGRFSDYELIKKASVPNLHILLKPKENQQMGKECKSMTAWFMSHHHLHHSKGNKIMPGSIKRIVSIPSKDMKGYVLENNGEALMILDSILNEDKTKGNNNTSNSNSNNQESKTAHLGPGTYDVKLKWKSNAIDWKKTSTSTNFTNINSNSNSNSNVNVNGKDNKSKKENKETLEAFNKAFQRQGEFIPHIPRTHNLEDKKLLYKSIHQRRKMNPLSIEKERKMSYMINTLSPGPGFYHKELIIDNNDNGQYTDDRNYNYRLSPQCKSGSHASRFQDYITSNNKNDEIGPGSYFKAKSKFEEDKKYFRGLHHKTLYQANEALIEKNKRVSSSNTFAGPGTYDIQQKLIKGSQSNKELLNSGPERFIPLLKRDKIPGPGEYLEPNIISKTISENSNKLMLSPNSKQNKNDRLIVKEPSSPPVGLYDSDVYGTIGYENQLKINRPQANIAPFLNTVNRFEKSNKPSPIGPGAYLKDNSDLLKYIPRTTKDVCFNNKEKRFKLIQSNSTSNVGPSDYDPSASLEWNKRTFNVLFFKPNTSSI